MTNDLTPAEQAAAEVIRADIWSAPREDLEEWARAVVAAVRSPLLDSVSRGWSIGPASDGCGEPGLYHECSEDNLTWLDGDDMGAVLRFIERHRCGEEDGLLWDAAGKGERPTLRVKTMPDCVFCDIVAKDSPAGLITEWDDAIAIHPLKPVTDGHILIIPRSHVKDFATDIHVTSITAGRACEFVSRLREPMDFNLITSKGESSTQTVFHLHMHLVPRRPGDGLQLPWTGQQGADRDPQIR